MCKGGLREAVGDCLVLYNLKGNNPSVKTEGFDSSLYKGASFLCLPVSPTNYNSNVAVRSGNMVATLQIVVA